jgi:hypothetical protein
LREREWNFFLIFFIRDDRVRALPQGRLIAFVFSKTHQKNPRGHFGIVTDNFSHTPFREIPAGMDGLSYTRQHVLLP